MEQKDLKRVQWLFVEKERGGKIPNRFARSEFLYYLVMNKDPDNRELEKRIELLKKDFDIMEANVNSTLNAMRTDIERGQKVQTRWIIGVGLALAALIFALWGLPLLP